MYLLKITFYINFSSGLFINFYSWTKTEKSSKASDLNEFFEERPLNQFISKQLPSIETSSPNYTTLLNNLIDYNLCDCLCHQNLIIGKLRNDELQLDNREEYDKASFIDKSNYNADTDIVFNTKKTTICSAEHDNDVTVETQTPEM